MGFGKAFLLSILAFVGLNFTFTIIHFALIPLGLEELFTTIQNDPLMILFYLFGPIICSPSFIFNWVITQPILLDDMSYLVLGLGYLIAPIIAAILAGRLGENKGQSFGGWLLTVVISTVLVVIGALLNSTLQVVISATYILGSFNEILVFSLINCVINLVFYGFFVLLLSKTEIY
jgi:hypothetical protein